MVLYFYYSHQIDPTIPSIFNCERMVFFFVSQCKENNNNKMRNTKLQRKYIQGRGLLAGKHTHTHRLNIQVCWSCPWGWSEPWPCSCWSSWGRPHISAWPGSSGQPAGGPLHPAPQSPSPPSASASPTVACGRSGWLQRAKQHSWTRLVFISALFFMLTWELIS